MKQITKKDHSKKKPNRKQEGHWEGKYWCSCRIRNYRLWLGLKKYGKTGGVFENFNNYSTLISEKD